MSKIERLEEKLQETRERMKAQDAECKMKIGVVEAQLSQQHSGQDQVIGKLDERLKSFSYALNAHKRIEVANTLVQAKGTKATKDDLSFRINKLTFENVAKAGSDRTEKGNELEEQTSSDGSKQGSDHKKRPQTGKLRKLALTKAQ